MITPEKLEELAEDFRTLAAELRQERTQQDGIAKMPLPHAPTEWDFPRRTETVASLAIARLVAECLCFAVGLLVALAICWLLV